MAVGLATTTFADKVLNHMLRATASTAPVANYVALALGDPGAAGTSNPTSVTTRVVVTYAASSGGSCSLTGTAPSWASWAGTSPTVITHIAVWDAVTAGTFLFSAILTASKSVTTGDTFTLSSLTISLAPLAA